MQKQQDIDIRTSVVKM